MMMMEVAISPQDILKQVIADCCIRRVDCTIENLIIQYTVAPQKYRATNTFISFIYKFKCCGNIKTA